MKRELHPVDLACGLGSVWVGVFDAARIDRINPRTGRVVARLPAGGTQFSSLFGLAVLVRHGLRIEPQA